MVFYLPYVISKSSSFLLQKNYCFELFFAALYFYIYESQIVSRIFKILFQIGDINIFVLSGVFFSGHFQLKSSFLMKKAPAVKSEIHFSRKALEN